MKKIFLAAGISLVTATATFAQNNISSDNETANPLIKGQFAMDFPNATNVDFESKKNFDEVSFTQDKEQISAYYDNNDQLIGTVEKKTFSDLPGKAQKEILKKYADYTITSVVKFNDNESDHIEMIQFGTSLNDEDNYFVELKNDQKAIIVKVDLSGGVDFLTVMR
jgi:hypothetical protein